MKAGPVVNHGYETLRKRGVALTQEDKALFKMMAWWSLCKTKTDAKVFLVAPRWPGNVEDYVDMEKLVAYAISTMDDHVVKNNERFAVVWVQFSDHRVWPHSAWSIKRNLHERYSTNLEAVHVVHPSWSIRFLRLALWPFASDEFWDKFECHERVEFLDTFMDVSKLELPQDIFEYDKFLDRQADELSQETAKQMSGRFGTFGASPNISGLDSSNDPETKKYQEQLDTLKKMMEEQEGK